MVNRNIESQLLHDIVIEKAVKYLNQTDFDIYINPGSSKNAGIGDNYPDIIMTEKGQQTVKFIIEVETSDSINNSEAINQWKKYATEINASFYLLIPEMSKARAITLCNQVGISVRFATFRVDRDNDILIKFD